MVIITNAQGENKQSRGENKMIKECYIGVGREGVFYTLWTFQPMIEAVGMNADLFIKNLSIDKEKALTEAKAWAIEHNYTFTGIEGETFGKRNQVALFNIAWSRKTKRIDDKRIVYFFGKATPEFWTEYNKDKEAMKQKGFRVSRYDVGGAGDNGAIWYVFYNPTNQEKFCKLNNESKKQEV